MRLDPERLLVLRAVADAGGVVAAGRRLRLAPSGYPSTSPPQSGRPAWCCWTAPAAAGQRPAHLTAAGRRLAVHAVRPADVLADAETDAYAPSGQIDGPAALAAFPTMIRRLVVPALSALSRTHPGIRPSVPELDEQPAAAALHAGEVDLVLVEDDASRPRSATAGCAQRWLLDDPYGSLSPSPGRFPRPSPTSPNDRGSTACA